MDTIRHVTPVLKDILDLCRFDLTYLTPCQNFTDAICHVTLNNTINIHKMARHNAEKHSCYDLYLQGQGGHGPLFYVLYC